MKQNILLGAFSGLCAAALAGLVEGLVGQGTDTAGAALLGIQLLVPVGVLTGVALSVIPFLWPEGRRPVDRLRILLSRNRTDASATLLVFGPAVLLGTAVLFHTIYFFVTKFHHMGLAALALTAVLPLLAASILLVARATARGLTKILDRSAPPPLRRPLVPAVMVLLLCLFALLPPLFKGPEAEGLFGFVGLLAKDGLKAGPLISLSLIAAAAVGIHLFASRKMPVSMGAPLFGAALIAALGTPFLANRTAAASPAAVDRLDSAEGAAGVLAKVIRKLGDRDGDGHSRWMGGQDCDDTNPDIYPRAVDIPGNGVDEDCSGADLDLAALKAKVGKNAAAATPVQALRRPALPEDVSLLLISIDSLRWNGTGFMGYERNVTPNLDKLAVQGTIYDRAYGLGSYTAQAVPPMMTGKYASELHRNDRHETRIGMDETFAAELICGENVRCGAYLPHFLFKPRAGWHQGFQDWTVVDASPPGPGHIDSKYNSDRITKGAIEWLDKPENTQGQFFLWAHYLDPHKEYIEHRGIEKFGDDRRSRYDHEVLYTDYHVGKLLDRFLSMDAAKRTIIIITADHGEAFNEHGRWCHGQELWEEIIRVPFAVAGPGIAKKRIARPTSQIDLFPTLLDIFGVEIPGGIHGRSLLPDWSDGPELEARAVIADQPDNGKYEPRRIFIKDDWKLHDLPGNNGYRLYHLTGDLEEGDSLVEKEPEAFERIKAAYDLFLAEELKPMKSVSYDMGPLSGMPLPNKK